MTDAVPQADGADSGDGAPFDPEVARNPQPSYKLMRDLAPVVELTEGQMRGVIVGKHGDVVEALRTPDLFSSGFDAVDIGQVRPLIPLQIDPPRHHDYRKLLDPLFAPRRVAVLEPRIRELAASLVDAVVADGGCDFNQAVAEPFPSTVFLELLGLPLDRTDEFIELKDGIIRPPATTPEEREAMVAVTGPPDLRGAGGGGRRPDRGAGRRLRLRLPGCRDRRHPPHPRRRHRHLLPVLPGRAGHGDGIARLHARPSWPRTPDHRRQLVDDPSLIPHAIEEMLRWETPVPGVVRQTTRDTEMSGCPIPAGKNVVVLLGSANTDEAAWDRADEVDFARPANKHLAFGGGRAPLPRLPPGPPGAAGRAGGVAPPHPRVLPRARHRARVLPGPPPDRPPAPGLVARLCPPAHGPPVV